VLKIETHLVGLPPTKELLVQTGLAAPDWFQVVVRWEIEYSSRLPLLDSKIPLYVVNKIN